MDKQRRKGIKQRRKERAKKGKKNIILIIVGVIVLVAAALLMCAFLLKNEVVKKEAVKEEAVEKEKEEMNLEPVKQAIGEIYQSYRNVREESVPASSGVQKTFPDWFVEYYSEQAIQTLAESEKNGELTESVLYHAVGESMHVAFDRYMGLLDNNVYEKSGKKKGEAEVTIAGDLCFAEDGFVLDHYDTVNDLSQCISPKLLEITNQSDLFYLNHEYAISDRGQPLNGKYYTFRAKPERMGLLKEMGTDLVALSNNHVYDFGPEAMLDTMALLKQAEISYLGGGADIEEAKQPVYFIVNGIKIGFVGASNAEKIRYTPQAKEDAPGILLAYDTTEYNQVIAEASKECDYLIAYIHWGTEDTNDYNSLQQEMGREFLASGADIVVGGHPHVLQGMEYVDGKPIVYSLGDFWFNDETKYTGMLQLHIGIEGLREMSFVPALQTGYTTQYLETAEEQEGLYQFLEELSPNISIDENGVISEKTLE